MPDPMDFDYFGKGIDGYVQYMQTFDQANKPDEPVSRTDEDMQSEFYVPRTAPVKQTSPSYAFHPAQQVMAAPEKSTGTQKKGMSNTLKIVLFVLGIVAYLWLVTR